ncbi:unnamed protein product [Ilex paraguariensis]|uniref:R13L1/DRL21-like LRR repeat region domain-containing protein n=1 Tax=Ilex paraguariensis TaxID=185542 RepID=A0ABC8QMB9_9AQUA
MLSIVGLENVIDVRDAEEANLSCEQELNELEFQWSSDIEDSQNERLKVSVLVFYRGITFSTWIGDRSFSKTVSSSLEGCRKCETLPPLGQLPLLKELYLKDMYVVKSVSAEFYSDDNTLEIPFPSLEILQFDKMPEWEKWPFSHGVDFRGLFPCLCELIIPNYPKLVSVPL